ncbi:MAG: hypothetical protein ABDK94_07475 [Atribacterota bacterium]
MKRWFVLFLVSFFLLGAVSGAQAVKLVVIGDAGHNLKPFEWYA